VVFCFGFGSLKASGNGRAVRTHLLQIYRSCNDFDVVETELRALSYDLSIHQDHGAPIKIHSIAVAALLVCIEIDTTIFPRGFRDEL
jgi:hypothetical protein